jgi:hypothetical protein
MPDSNYHLEHAQHNNDALKYLGKSPKFLDWVITMCFYTSLHILQYKIFPLKVKASNSGSYTIKTFEEYCSHFREIENSKHDKLSDLAYNYCADIGAQYNSLKDLCWTARYRDYTTDRDLSNLAKDYKNQIFEYCKNK